MPDLAVIDSQDAFSLGDIKHPVVSRETPDSPTVKELRELLINELAEDFFGFHRRSDHLADFFCSETSELIKFRAIFAFFIFLPPYRLIIFCFFWRSSPGSVSVCEKKTRP